MSHLLPSSTNSNYSAVGSISEGLEPIGKLPAHNPFSTRQIRPGALTFDFPVPWSLEKILARFTGHRYWGQIVGPHGSGKSTLLCHLVTELEQAGKSLIVFHLHDSQRSLPYPVEQDGRLDSQSIVVVDGYEQLTPWNRWLLIRLCRRRGAGLLVTTHRPLGLPELFTTQTSTELLRRIAQRLMSGYSSPPFDEEVLEQEFYRYQGDLRQTLFALYDLYEARKHPIQPPCFSSPK